jgi:hypothetical protein
MRRTKAGKSPRSTVTGMVNRVVLLEARAAPYFKNPPRAGATKHQRLKEGQRSNEQPVGCVEPFGTKGASRASSCDADLLLLSRPPPILVSIQTLHHHLHPSHGSAPAIPLNDATPSTSGMPLPSRPELWCRCGIAGWGLLHEHLQFSAGPAREACNSALC